jgi:hypothetical protein
MAHPFIEFPKWLHAAGHKSVLVHDAEAEARQLALWTAEAPSRANALMAEPEPIDTPRKGGWPKGKPRTVKHQPSVN